MFFYYQNLYNEFENYNISILIFNIVIYIFMLVNMFIILFLFDLKYIKTLNELKFLNNISLFNIFIVLIFLSFAGTPPLIGFVSKFLIFIIIFYKQNFFIFFIFLFLNFFSMYFYLQNLRFAISKKIVSTLIYKNNQVSFNINIIYLLNLINFFNLIGILYFEDFFIFLNFLSSNINY